MNMSYDRNVKITTADLTDVKLHISYNDATDMLEAVVSGKHGDRNVVSDTIVGTANVNKEIQTICTLIGYPLRSLASGVRDEDKVILIDREVLNHYDLQPNNKLLKKKNVRTIQAQAQPVQQNQPAQPGPQPAQQNQPAQPGPQPAQQNQPAQPGPQPVQQNQTAPQNQTGQQNQNSIGKKIVKGLIVTAVGIGLFALADYILTRDSGSVRSNTNSNTNNQTRTSVTEQYSGNNYENGIPVGNGATYYEGNGGTVVVNSNNSGYDYTSLGCAVNNIDMETQLQNITSSCFDGRTHDFYNQVVSNDRATMRVICEMRDGVVNGQYSGRSFIDNIVNYVFNGSLTFNGKSVKSFYEISPYSEFAVIRMSQGILQMYCSDYSKSFNGATYDIYGIASIYESMEDDLYRTLTGRGYSR